jgi:hypothetical protein
MVIDVLLSVLLFVQPPARNYYVHASGNDGNDGGRQHPWKTMAAVNRAQLQPGDSLFFHGGDIFEGSLRLTASGTSGHPIVISSYGKGKAVIDGGKGSSIVFSGAEYISVSALELKGAGRKKGNAASGWLIDSCHHIMADSLLVHGFQKSGVYIYRSADVQLTRIFSHENGFAGIAAEGRYGSRNCQRILIRDCRAENNPGDPSNLTNHSGNGIVVGSCRNVLIEKCTATNNGWDMPRIGNGPVGIWAYEADSVIISACTSFRNRTARGADDGGGFDLDGGVTHSVIEHCVSYENEGSGYGIFQYAGAAAWHDNSIHDCVSNDDGLVSAARAGVFIWNSCHDARQQMNFSFYNNVVTNTKGAAIHFASEGAHKGFRFYHNTFIVSDSLIKGKQATDDVFYDNRWSGLRPSPWLDSVGHSINAHGAGVLFHNGIWYLYGEIKKGPTRLVPGQDWEDFRVGAGGVSCYSSRDLEHWKYEGIALAPEKNDTASDLHTSRVIERPKVVYNSATRQFVMWMHIDREDYSYARAGVAVSERPEGPFRYIRSMRPDGEMSRDMTLFKDDDGTAYLIYTSENNNTMHVSRLSKDYLAPAGTWKRILIDQRREAPAVFRHQGKYYLITSLCSGWDPNAANCAAADSMLGEWRQQGNPCKGPGAAITFGAQSTFVLPLQPEQGRYLFMADRWNKKDLEHSGYCWLPLNFNGDEAQIREDSSILRELPVTPLSVVDYNIKLKGDSGVRAWSFLRFFDSTGRRLLEYTVPCTMTGAVITTGNYSEAPPNTALLTVSLVTAQGTMVDVSGCEVHVTGDPAKKAPLPLCDLRQYMRPFWKSDTIFEETVLLLSDGRGLASGRLLYTPDRILSVKNYGLDTTYIKGVDYSIKGRTLYRAAGSSMPYRMDSSFDRTHNIAWYDLQSRWVSVTYIHHDPWTGAIPSYKGHLLAGVMEKLNTGAPIAIVAYGMSITRGMDVSGYDSVRPYMPSYMELFRSGLQRSYPGSRPSLFNAALPGATVAWGAEHAAQYIAPLHPDLTVIDFGMNDFWGMPPETFRDSVKAIIRKVRAADPAGEFILLANMSFDPDYVLGLDRFKSWYTGNMKGYRNVLQELEGPGIACLDMYTLSEAIYRRKKAKDCLVNPLHPNDYMARWHAQGLLALFMFQ